MNANVDLPAAIPVALALLVSGCAIVNSHSIKKDPGFFTSKQVPLIAVIADADKYCGQEIDVYGFMGGGGKDAGIYIDRCAAQDGLKYYGLRIDLPEMEERLDVKGHSYTGRYCRVMGTLYCGIYHGDWLATLDVRSISALDVPEGVYKRNEARE